MSKLGIFSCFVWFCLFIWAVLVEVLWWWRREERVRERRFGWKCLFAYTWEELGRHKKEKEGGKCSFLFFAAQFIHCAREIRVPHDGAGRGRRIFLLHRSRLFSTNPRVPKSCRLSQHPVPTMVWREAELLNVGISTHTNIYKTSWEAAGYRRVWRLSCHMQCSSNRRASYPAWTVLSFFLYPRFLSWIEKYRRPKVLKIVQKDLLS